MFEILEFQKYFIWLALPSGYIVVKRPRTTLSLLHKRLYKVVSTSFDHGVPAGLQTRFILWLRKKPNSLTVKHTCYNYKQIA